MNIGLTPFLISPRGERPTLQPGSFAKIAHRAIFRRSALPWGKAGKGVSRIKTIANHAVCV